jgi:sulfur carrier protein
VRLIANGEKHDIDATTLSSRRDPRARLRRGQARATALNGEFAPARARAATHMKEGDRIEILAPRGGGT